MKAFENDSNFVINEQVEVFATPGHTLDSVSVSVKTSKGKEFFRAMFCLLAVLIYLFILGNLPLHI